MLRETLENLGRSSSAEETHAYCVDDGGPRGSAKSRPSWRLRAVSGHLFDDKMATYHPPGVAGEVTENHTTPSVPSDSFGRNTVWIFTSSVFMTVGGADAPWHPQFF